MDTITTQERRKYEQMWAFAEYREDHATAHARAALDLFGAARGDSLIDFGAGAGYASRWFQDEGLRVLAIDIAGNAMAPEIAARVPRLIGSFWDMPVELGADWGFCCDVMEHIPTAHVDDVLRFIRRSTRKATYFSIALRADWCGRLIDESLHLTVQPLEWWLDRIGAVWSDVRVVSSVNGHAAELVARP